jgi:hypothetical protein
VILHFLRPSQQCTIHPYYVMVDKTMLSFSFIF